MKYYSSERNVQMLIYLMKANGIRKVVVSPGATNICFVYSIQQDPFFELFSSVDERSAAYIACGLAAESGEVVALSCTGATASRNYYPGMTEAFYRKLPILAITSTQPKDRCGNGIPQVTDRSVIAKDVAKLSVYIPMIHCVEDELNVIVNLNKALLELDHHGKGPVHINLETEYSTDYSVKVLPKTRYIKRHCDFQNAPVIGENMRVAIFVGNHEKWDSALIQKVEAFCERHNAVVLCDQTSNYTGKYGVMGALSTYQECKDEKVGKFDILIHLGEISGAYLRISAGEVWRINIDGVICDTFRALTNVFEMEEMAFFEYYSEGNKNVSSEFAFEYEQEYERLYKGIPDLPFSNIWIAKRTAPLLPQGSELHIAILNSLRSWNFFNTHKSIVGCANTGGFGIDGCLSSLIGASLLNREKLYFGIIGDLAFFYDMNSLGNRHIAENLRILVISNGCGAEFKNYNHWGTQFGEDVNKYIAGEGHFGNKSKDLLKNYAENLGLEYISANNKVEYEANMEYFTENKRHEKSLVFEVFVTPEDESEALRMISQIDGVYENEKRYIVLPKCLKNKENVKFVVWGTGVCFEKNLAMIEAKFPIEYAVDNNREKWGKEMSGLQVISPNELKSMDNVFVIIMLEGTDITMQVANQLIGMNILGFDSVYNCLSYDSDFR